MSSLSQKILANCVHLREQASENRKPLPKCTPRRLATNPSIGLISLSKADRLAREATLKAQRFRPIRNRICTVCTTASTCLLAYSSFSNDLMTTFWSQNGRRKARLARLDSHATIDHLSPHSRLDTLPSQPSCINFCKKEIPQKSSFQSNQASNHDAIRPSCHPGVVLYGSPCTGARTSPELGERRRLPSTNNRSHE